MIDVDVQCNHETPEEYKARLRNEGARQALKDYADLLDGPTYTMNWGSAREYAEQVIYLLRRDADLLYPAAN